MKNIFRKAMTVLGSAALIGMTVGTAAAAAYPSPFTSDTAIVVGANAAPSDGIAAALVASNLDANIAGTTTSGTSGTITGETASLASGTDLLYLNDEFNENIATLTKDNFPTVLADGVFTDDEGTTYDFEQTLTVGTGSSFAFSNSDNDLDDPALITVLSTTVTAASAIYDLTATFNTAVPFNATNSEGEEIILFGKTYTVGTATDADTLVLLGGADSSIIQNGESTTMVVNGVSYDVRLTGLSSATATQASITVNGDSKTFTQGQTKTIAGIDVYAKTVFREGDALGYVEVQLGADKLTFETGSSVKTGSDNDDIEGTLVTIVGGVNAMTSLKITVAAEDNDANHLLVGESFVDPVFGTVLVNFDGVENGPEFTGEKDTGRTELEIRKGGNRELQVSLTDSLGNVQTVPFTYQDALSDDDGNTISVVEGASISDEGYFILNSGNNQHFMQVTDLNLDDSAGSDVTLKDVITGESIPKIENHDFTNGYDWTYKGQTYTIVNDSASTITIVSSDYGTGIADGNDVDVFPVIELVSGEDTRFAYTDNVTALTDFISGGVADAKTVTLNLPTGTLAISNSATNTSIRVAGAEHAASATTAYLVGDVYYTVAIGAGSLTTNATTVTVAVEATPSTSAGTTPVTTPGLLFVEDEDKSEATTTTKPAIHVVTTDSGTYSTVSAPLFTGTSDTETWDDTDFTGWLTNYGTYVWRDTSDTNQNFVGLSYPDAQMYAEVSFAEGEVSTTTTDTAEAGALTFKDTETASFEGMNLIVVGGSAINSVAASLLGSAYSEAAFTAATATATTPGVAAGEFLIQSFARTGGKTALLVAGYNAADTTNAVNYLTNEDVTTTVGTKLKGTSATEATLVTA